MGRIITFWFIFVVTLIIIRKHQGPYEEDATLALGTAVTFVYLIDYILEDDKGN